MQYTAVDDIFVASMGPSLDYLKDKDMLGNLLAKTVPSLTIVQHILFFVYPERVLLSRLPEHSRRLLRQDFSLIRLHRRRRYDYPAGGLPVTLLCAAPGMWAQLLPQLGPAEEEPPQDALCFQGHTEGFAATALSIARHGAAVCGLRIAVDMCEEPARGPPANGAAALLFSLIARGDLGHLKHLTLLYTGGGRIDDCAFLTPLAQRSAMPLRSLRSLRLSLADPVVHLPILTRFAKDRAGFPNLRTLTFFGSDSDSSSSSSSPCVGIRRPADADVAALLQAILKSHRRHTAPGAAGSGGATSGLPLHPLAEIDLRATLAGHETLQVLVDRLEQCQDQKWLLRQMVIKLEATPAATLPENVELYGHVQKLLPANPN